MANGRGTALQPMQVVQQQLEKARGEIAAVLPKHMDADKVIRAVRLAVAQNNSLLECDPKTILFSVMAACRLGLELNSPLQHAWLIPYNRECTLQIGYRGYQELARRGGDVRDVQARVVYQGDDFRYRLGTNPLIEHIPMEGERTDDKITHAYAVAFYKDGGPPIFEVLPREEIEKARKVSRFSTKEGSPWMKWYAEMARKTAVRRLAKYLPLSPEFAAAVELDIRGETGEVHAPIAEIDTDVSLNDAVAQKTRDRLDEVKSRLGGQQAATPPVEQEKAPAPSGAASESSPAPAKPAPAAPVNEETPPW